MSISTSSSSTSEGNFTRERSNPQQSSDAYDPNTPAMEEKYREMNRMLVLSFMEIFDDPAFKRSHNITRAKRIHVMEWIVDSGHRSAKRIVERITPKAEKRIAKEPSGTQGQAQPENSVKAVSRKDLIDELNQNQVLQTYQTAIALSVYAEKDIRVRQVFDITFIENGCKIAFLNAGRYIQAVCQTGKPRNTPLPTGIPSVFEVLLWHHCVNMLSSAVQTKQLTSGKRINYMTGNIIGYVVQEVYSAWSIAIRKTGSTTRPSQVLAPYLYYNPRTGMFNALAHSDGFSPTTQLTSFLPVQDPTPSGPSVDAVATGRSVQQDKAYRQLAYALLLTLKEILVNNNLYNVELQHIKDLPQIRILRDRHPDGVPYVFAQLDEELLNAINLTKPEPNALQVYNVEDNTCETVGHMQQLTGKPLDQALLYRGRAGHLQPPNIAGNVRKRGPSSGNHGRGSHKTRKLYNTGGDGDELANTQRFGVKEEEDIVDVIEPFPEQMDQVTKEAYDKLVEGIAPFVNFYTCHFSDLPGNHSDEIGESLVGVQTDSSEDVVPDIVDLVLADPPYNTRRNLGRQNSEYDNLKEEDMEAFTKLVKSILRKGGHAIVFCSMIQFPDWVHFFHSRTKKIFEAHPTDPEETVKRMRRVFNIEDIPLTFIRAKGNYNTNPLQKRLNHINMSEVAVHLWRKGLDTESALQRVNYKAEAGIPSTLAGWTNVIDNIPRVPGHEIVYSDNSSTTMIRPEQKSIKLMSTLVERFSPPGGTVVDPFCGTMSVAKACLSVNPHRRCICSDMDKDCIDKSMPSLVEVFARQILNTSSDIKVRPELQQAATTYLRSRKTLDASKMKVIWYQEDNLPPLQLFPKHIISFLSSMHGDQSLSNTYSRLAYPRWSLKWRACFSELDINSLLSVELTVQRLHLKKSSIPGAGQGIFTDRALAPGDFIGYFYGHLLYDNISIGASAHTTDTIGESLLTVPCNEFKKWSIELSVKANVGSRTNRADDRPVWIYPVPFCAMRYVNDGRDKRYPDRTPQESSNAEFVESTKDITNVGLQSYDIVTVVATKNIAANAEIFVDYGEYYNCFGE